MPLESGASIGAYIVIAKLGEGGMGEVYRARDSKLKREVAIKVLPADVATDRERLARFQREAEVLASLNHPHIAHVYGIEDGALVMELVEGEDLSQRIARGPVPLDEALPIARQIAEALEAAHEQGIIHRDLKPSNIKVTDDGTVKVLDFGLAKALEQGSGITDQGSGSLANSPTITSPAMTMRGVILGTAAYMSPEQAKGRPVDKRSDLWSFGCVLYEMLTGQRAFEGEDVSDTLAAVLRGQPDWSRLPPSTPPLLIEAVRGCLNRDRRQRVADASTVRFALDSATVQTGARLDTTPDVTPLVTSAVAADRRRVRRHYLLPLAGLCLALAIASVYLWFRPQSAIAPPAVSRFILNLPQDAQPATARHALAISDDGRQVAYLAVGSLELRRVSEFDARRVASAQGLSTPLFSPDGRTLVFHEAFQNVIRRVSTTGGAPVDVCPISAPFGLSWDNGTLLVGLGRQGVARCALSGGNPQAVLSAGSGEELHGPQMLPDGDHLLFTVAKTADGETRWDKSNIVVESLSTHTRTVLIEGATDGRLLSTGHLVFAREGVVFAVPFDASARRALGDPTPVVEGVRRPVAGTTGAAQFAVSASGSLVYLPGPARTTGAASRVLAIATREGTVSRLPAEAGRYVHTRVSPDGKQLAVGSDDGRTAVIWIYALGGTAAMRRLVLPGRNEFPIWSPDSKQLAFLSDGLGDRGLFVQSADGTGAAVRLTTAAPDETHIPEAWSPNGQHLVFAVRKGEDSLNTSGDYALRMLDRTTQQVSSIAITSREPIGAVFSPDGKWLAVSQSAGEGGATASSRGVYIQRFPSGESYQAPKQALDFHVTWSPRGDELIYVRSAASGQLAIVPVQTSPQVQFGTPALIPARVTGGRVSSMARAYDVMPDGRFVGIVTAGESQDIPRLEVRVVLNWFEELRSKVAQPGQ